MKTTLFLLSVIVGFFSFGVAANQNELPSNYTENSEYSISYADWDLLLSSIVLETGLSDRRPAGRSGTRITGSKRKHGNTSVTAFEGNRILFYLFKDEHVEQLIAIRRDLEAVPNFAPLERFSKNEQLAYWLNLHNLAVTIEVARAYPVRKLRYLTSGGDSPWDAKSMSIGGVPTSIRDIQRHVVKNWNDPLVIYGFFTGAVGGPNIRASAFTGENVIEALQNNAVEFVNSLRGYRAWSGYGRVSEHYEIGRRYFPNFDEDIKAHLLKYARESTRPVIAGVGTFRADSYDWTIADLKAGDVFNGGIFNTSSAALALFLETDSGPGGSAGTGLSFVSDGSVDKGRGTTPLQIRSFIRAVQDRYARRARRGEVTVEEFIDDDSGRVTTKKKEE